MDRLSQLLAFHEQNPTDSFILFALAKEYEMRDENKAIFYYKKLMDVDENYVGLYYHFGNLLKSNDKDAAQTIFEKGIAIAKKIGDHHALSELQSAKLNMEYED